MRAERLLLIAAAYHGLFALVLLAVPQDVFAFLELPLPNHWFIYYFAAAGPAAVACCLEGARRSDELRSGLLAACVAACAVGGGLMLLFVLLHDLPKSLLGPAVAGWLWAYLLLGVLSPEGAAQPGPESSPARGARPIPPPPEAP